jgi:hypothetical protein
MAADYRFFAHFVLSLHRENEENRNIGSDTQL